MNECWEKKQVALLLFPGYGLEGRWNVPEDVPLQVAFT